MWVRRKDQGHTPTKRAVQLFNAVVLLDTLGGFHSEPYAVEKEAAAYEFVSYCNEMEKINQMWWLGHFDDETLIASPARCSHSPLAPTKLLSPASTISSLSDSESESVYSPIGTKRKAPTEHPLDEDDLIPGLSFKLAKAAQMDVYMLQIGGKPYADYMLRKHHRWIETGVEDLHPSSFSLLRKARVGEATADAAMKDLALQISAMSKDSPCSSTELDTTTETVDSEDK
jgi:hypothetical protein